MASSLLLPTLSHEHQGCILSQRRMANSSQRFTPHHHSLASSNQQLTASHLKALLPSRSMSQALWGHTASGTLLHPRGLPPTLLLQMGSRRRPLRTGCPHLSYLSMLVSCPIHPHPVVILHPASHNKMVQPRILTAPAKVKLSRMGSLMISSSGLGLPHPRMSILQSRKRFLVDISQTADLALRAGTCTLMARTITPARTIRHHLKYKYKVKVRNQMG